MRVTEIWRYPVKSLGGERLQSADVDELGIRGDRAWGLYDPDSGTVLTARREPELLFLSSQLVDGRAIVSTHDGVVLDGDRALSEHLGRPVELHAASSGPGTFENPMDVDNESDWVAWESSGGTFHDGRSKISLVSARSLGDWDRRRFRINVILDGGGEDRLTGEIAVGSATLHVRQPIERCIMITRAQPGIDKNVSVLKRIVRERDNKLGIGAVITTPGTIRVGDVIVS